MSVILPLNKVYFIMQIKYLNLLKFDQIQVTKSGDILHWPTPTDMFNDQNLEVVSDVELVGYLVKHDLKWQMNTDCICSRGSQKLWMIF